MKILGVSGSLRVDGSNTLTMVKVALDSARECGAEVELLDLRKANLPLYEAEKGYNSDSVVVEVRKKVKDADAYILGSPEYHGCMSGALKNFLDYHYKEFAGKLSGIVIATGGTQGFTTLEQIRTAMQDCHCWTLPYHASAVEDDFDEKSNLLNKKVEERCKMVGRDVVFYGSILYDRFCQDIKTASGWKSGFAQWHIPK